MKLSLSKFEALALQTARDTAFPLPVTGFLLDVVIVDCVAFGHIYAHVKADPLTGRFTDGHLIHTSAIATFHEHAGFVILHTRNSHYVCVLSEADKDELLRHLKWLSKPTLH